MTEEGRFFHQELVELPGMLALPFFGSFQEPLYLRLFNVTSPELVVLADVHTVSVTGLALLHSFVLEGAGSPCGDSGFWTVARISIRSTLVECGADPEKTDRDGVTPLYAAATWPFGRAPRLCSDDSQVYRAYSVGWALGGSKGRGASECASTIPGRTSKAQHLGVQGPEPIPASQLKVLIYGYEKRRV